MRTAGPYVVAMSWKDRTWEQNLGFLGEGGPYPGRSRAARPARACGGRGGGGGRGGAARRRRGARRAGGRACRGCGGRRAARPAAGAARRRPAGAAGQRQALAGAGAAGGGRPRPAAAVARRRARRRRLAEFRVRSRATRSRAAAAGRRRTCRWARAWSTSSGTPRCCATSASTGRWSSKPNTRSAALESGADKLTLPRDMVIGSLKRDVLTIRAALGQSGTGLTI